MTASGHILHSNAGDRSVAGTHVARMPLQVIAGFLFAYKLCFIYLGFQSDPRAGTIASLTCSVLLLAAALIYTLGDAHFSMRLLLASRTLRWVVAYLAVSGASLFWTNAFSTVDAAGQWTGMVMEVATVLLLVKKPNVDSSIDALMKGFVVGMLVVGAAAWLSPVTDDFRIGNEEFLHPNLVGLYSAFAFFLAQQLALKDRAWRWCCLALGITLLRSISKTSIIAFLIAESFYLLREKQIPRSIKVKMAAVAAVVIASFATVLQANLTTYVSGNVNQAESLTGRTVVWATAFSIAIQSPWIGHGFQSFRALVPAFGIFEPKQAHNELLEQFFEYGLLGVAVTIALYLSLFFAAKRSAANNYRDLVFVVMLFAVIHGLTESLNLDLTVPLWLTAAVSIAFAQSSETATS
jgi:exopolysaccharide production protein ExoQ